MMDSADPYSDGILKMPIVIDNVSIPYNKNIRSDFN